MANENRRSLSKARRCADLTSEMSVATSTPPMMLPSSASTGRVRSRYSREPSGDTTCRSLSTPASAARYIGSYMAHRSAGRLSDASRPSNWTGSMAFSCTAAPRTSTNRMSVSNTRNVAWGNSLRA